MKHTEFHTLTDDELIAHGQITDVQGYTLELLQRFEKLLSHIGNLQREANGIYYEDPESELECLIYSINGDYRDA